MRESYLTMSKIVKDNMKGGASILCPELNNLQNPEDILNSIQYEKGFYLLVEIEKLFGGEETMNRFLREYLRAHARGNTSTPIFKEFLKNFFISEFGNDEKYEGLKIDEWLFLPGFPPKLHHEAFEDEGYKRMVDLFEQFKAYTVNESTDVSFLKQNIELMIEFST